MIERDSIRTKEKCMNKRFRLIKVNQRKEEIVKLMTLEFKKMTMQLKKYKDIRNLYNIQNKLSSLVSSASNLGVSSCYW